LNEVRAPRHARREYSLFWPIVFIGVGVIWLLQNLGLISLSHVADLLRLWPLALILMGLDLLFGRRWPLMGALIGVVAVLLALWILWSGPLGGREGADMPTLFGMPVIHLGGSDLKEQHFSEPLGEATTARVTLGLYEGRGHVAATSDGNDLISVQTNQNSAVDFSASGTRDKTITVRNTSPLGPGAWFNGDRASWEVLLSPRVPLDLRIEGSSSHNTLDLSRLQLSALRLGFGSGSSDVTLPASGPSYRGDLGGGSGSLVLRAPDGAQADLKLNGGSGSSDITLGDAAVRLEIYGGSGSVHVRVAREAGLRVEVQSEGSGSIHLPSGDAHRGTTWESSNYAKAAHQSTLILHGASGSVNIEQ
jgi:hypothetical protein